MAEPAPADLAAWSPRPRGLLARRYGGPRARGGRPPGLLQGRPAQGQGAGDRAQQGVRRRRARLAGVPRPAKVDDRQDGPQGLRARGRGRLMLRPPGTLASLRLLLPNHPSTLPPLAHTLLALRGRPRFFHARMSSGSGRHRLVCVGERLRQGQGGQVGCWLWTRQTGVLRGGECVHCWEDGAVRVGSGVVHVVGGRMRVVCGGGAASVAGCGSRGCDSDKEQDAGGVGVY